MSQTLPSNPSASFVERNPHLYAGNPKAGPKPEPKRIRQSSKPLVNKLEAEFSRVLQDRNKHYCPIHAQAMRFKLGNGIWFKPDFFCAKWCHHSCSVLPFPTCWEVKGPHAFRGGFENLKVAASLYPEIKWVLAWKEHGQWKEQLVLP